MGFVAFWLDVLWESTVAVIACFGLVGNAVAFYRFGSKHQHGRRPTWLEWLLSERQHRVRLRILVTAIAVSVMWTTYDRWAMVEQARTRQQFPRFPIGYSAPSFFLRLESTDWMELGTPAVPYDWSTVPPDADVFATLRVRMAGGDRNARHCRAVRVRVRDLGVDLVAGESERVDYVANGNQDGEGVVRIRLERRTRLASYVLEVASDSAECPVNVQGEIGAEYR